MVPKPRHPTSPQSVLLISGRRGGAKSVRGERGKLESDVSAIVVTTGSERRELDLWRVDSGCCFRALR